MVREIDEELGPDLFEIDQYALDIEWKKQPAMMHKYTQLLAKAEEEWELAKLEKDTVEAKLDRDIRADPPTHGLKEGIRITENWVEKTILTQKEYVEAYQKVIKSNFKYNSILAKVRALDHKKKALENLVHLWCADYYSEPRGPKGVSRDKVDEVVRKTTKKSRVIG